MKKQLLFVITPLLLMLSISSFAADKVSPLTIEGASSIDTSKAKELFDKGALFVDVRSNKDWDAGRIPDAVHLELKKVFNEQALSKEAGKDEAMVIYCNGEKCLRSSKATSLAVSWGFKNLFYYRDGLPAWKKAGYPVE